MLPDRGLGLVRVEADEAVPGLDARGRDRGLAAIAAWPRSIRPARSADVRPGGRSSGPKASARMPMNSAYSLAGGFT
jgi:hypothetical protein